MDPHLERPILHHPDAVQLSSIWRRFGTLEGLRAYKACRGMPCSADIMITMAPSGRAVKVFQDCRDGWIVWMEDVQCSTLKSVTHLLELT